MKIGIIANTDRHKNLSIGKSRLSRIRINIKSWFTKKDNCTGVSSIEKIIFNISLNELSYNNLMHSAFATPGRYIMELYARVSGVRSDDDNDGILILNPYISVPLNTVNRAVDYIGSNKARASVLVLADTRGVPIAYFFKRHLQIKEFKFLSLLSAMDSELDTSYLRNALIEEVEVFALENSKLGKHDCNGFNSGLSYERIYSWITRSAIAALSASYGSAYYTNDDITALSDKDISAKKHIRDALKFTAIMPHHAGDVLFLALALRSVTSHVNSVAVSARYEEILREVAPDVRPLLLDLTPIMRKGSTKTDDEFFWDVVSLLSDKDLISGFFYFFRPSREYRISGFHLIDHFAFALGESCTDMQGLWSHRQTIRPHLPSILNIPPKILLHFEGGWPLKVYPEEKRRKLLDKLINAGFQVTVLGNCNYIHKNLRAVTYEGLNNYKQLLNQHHVLVGMDSFPVHFAAYIMGTPAICIFGNTKPVNSCAPVSSHYRYVIGCKPCAGCFSYDRCHINDDKTCSNFPEPEMIFSSVAEMTEALYFNVNR